MFGRQAMSLLELACRVCAMDASGKAIQDLSDAIDKREPRYFTKLPGVCWHSKRRAFGLPSKGSNPDNQLIAAVFNLVRNGLSHQYQQMRAALSDGKEFGVSLTGADYGSYLSNTFAQGRPSKHLSTNRDQNNNLWVTVMPNVFFLDVRDAIREIFLIKVTSAFDHMVEGGKKTFNFSSNDAENAFRANRHM